MIQTKDELKECLNKDAVSYRRVVFQSFNFKSILHVLRARYLTTPISDQYIIWKYIKTLRKVEYYSNNRSVCTALLLIYYVRKYLKLGRITGFQIPINAIDKGLIIWHYGTIIINQDSKIGKNCTLRPDIVIGHKDGESESPIIGDYVEINSGARIIGGIHVGDDVIIAPNAVVTRDIPSHSIVAGIPAKIIKTRTNREENWKSLI